MTTKRLTGDTTVEYLPPPTQPRLGFIMPAFTHGVPGVFVGGVLTSLFVANHIINSVWNTIPIDLSILCAMTGLAWLITLAERKVADRVRGDDDYLNVFICFAIALFIAGFISTGVTWFYAHPGQPAQTSCKGHGGGDAPLDYNLKPSNGSRYSSDVIHVLCHDGSGFDRVSQN